MIKNRDVFKLRSSSRLFIPTIESITIIIIIVVIIILPKCRSR